MPDDDWLDLTTKTHACPDKPGTGETQSVDQERALLIMLVGSEANRTFTVGEETLIGRSAEATIQIVDDDISRSHAQITRTGPGRFTIEDLGSKNGTLVNGVPIKMQLLRYGDKIRIGSQTIFMFSEYDHLEDQLLQTQRLESIGRLAGGVAHDFNNILGAVLANVGFLKGISRQTTFGDEEVRESLDDIDGAVRRAVDLTRQLLGLARQEHTEQRHLDFSSLLGEVNSLVTRTFEREIAVETDIDAELVLLGDPSQLHQMLMNLCINARDAMPQGGALNLVARRTRLEQPDLLRLPFLRPGLFVEVVVRDTGSGMDELVRRRIFEPFFTTKQNGMGTGLGLATVYKIVKQHGGHIDVDSKVGQGSSFRIYLPAVDEPVPEGEPDIYDLDTGSTGTGTVLLVDDEEVFLKSTGRLLEGLGFTVLLAQDGDQALEVYKQEGREVQLVLLDMIMPRRNGGDTFHALRALDPRVRVVLSSGQTQARGVRDLLAAGARGYLQKPYDAKALSEAISRALIDEVAG
jgi:signal transduction histidine kinase/CheY-like chemotaxis protein